MLKALSLCFVLALAGCSLSGARFVVPPPAPADAVPGALSPGKYIKHVVIVIQENRSFENIFAGYPGANAPMRGRTSDGKSVRLHEITFDAYDFSHSWEQAITDWNRGKMNGFDRSFTIPRAGRLAAYAYLNRKQVAPYWAMARQYALADAMFPTEFGPSFTAHLDLIASTASLSAAQVEVNSPTASQWGCNAPAGTTTYTLDSKRVISPNGPPPCFNQFATMANTLDAGYRTWAFYAPTLRTDAGIWSTFSSIRRVYYGKDWRRNVVTPQTRVLAAAKTGRLPSVAWVVPDALDSDHPAIGSDKGPSWVASVVNAIGGGPDWKSTAIVVLWDDWGGWYDNAEPPQLDSAGLGIRVPCLIISPYARAGYVSHTQYEFGSILHFVEDTFGLPALGPPPVYTDRRGNSIVDAFDFTQKPRKFVPIPAPYGPEYFLTRPSSYLPPDND